MPKPDVASNSKNMVRSLAKGLSILVAFTASEPELTLSQAASRAGLDRGTSFRLLNTLVHLGYLEPVPNTRRYRLTLKVLDLGFNAIARMGLNGVARPILRSLVGEVNEAASIGVLDGVEVVYIERVEAGLARLGVDVRVGTRIPAYCTAIGHAILAFLPREDRLRILRASDRPKLTPRTPVTLAEIGRRLEEVRRRGFAISDQEVVNGLRVISAPVLDDDGQPVAALSVAAPVLHMPLDEFVSLAAGAWRIPNQAAIGVRNRPRQCTCQL